EDIPIGSKVSVPLGKRVATGVVVSETKPDEKVAINKIKSIFSVDTEYPVLSEPYLRWAQWLSDYYFYPLGLILSLAYPPLPKTTKVRASKKAPVMPVREQEDDLPLTSDQEKCFNDIKDKPGFGVHLIHGVTGSGKTEIYLRMIKEVQAKGKKALYLVPEISLTPQLVERFARRFKDQTGVLHSQLTEREKTNQWWALIENKFSVLVGARSALFCPVDDWGLIIIDEEHESSFKQDEKLRYNARDAAIVKAKELGIPVILGSATPSLESWKNALDGRYHLHTLKKRVFKQDPPEIQILDLRNEKKNNVEENSGAPSWLSKPLEDAIREELDKGKQIALFLNRRGQAQSVLCPACGYSKECPNCDIHLTLHHQKYLTCHYCDYQESFKLQCPDCKEGVLQLIGIGTEQVQRDLEVMFPDKVIQRADRDEISTREELEELIQNMELGKTDILIGTQMIAKGLDFPNLNLVGFVLADIGFNIPDFRATERSFQIITQMAGRAGRHIKTSEEKARVLIQAYNTEHESLKYLSPLAVEDFMAKELEFREVLSYPPYSRLICLRIQGPDKSLASQAADGVALRGHSLKKQNPAYANIQILGPAEAPMAKLRNQYRYQVLIKGPKDNSIHNFLRQFFHDLSWVDKKVRIIADVDPLNML
ncbi:MAG: primosomal protein N', partial [Bdellovibrionota bacterium]